MAGGNNLQVQNLAGLIYGEAASEDYDTMKMVGSTVINRLLSKRNNEFGHGLGEIMNKENAYYAVQNQNEPYRQAMTKNFPDEGSANKYKRALAIASGLVQGTISPSKGQFYFKKDEIKKLKKKGKKAFNFKAVKEVDSVGDYQVFGY